MVGGGNVSGRENSMIVTPHTVTEAIGDAPNHKMLGLGTRHTTRPAATPCDECGEMLVPAGVSPGKWEWDCPNPECGVSRWDLRA